MSNLTSVVIPTHNRAHFLKDCFESLHRQTHSNYEVILVDDASTDNPRRIYDRYKKRRWHFLRNDQIQGPGRSRQRALEKARGRFVAFLDSDDVWAPDKLERQIKAFKRASIVMSHTARYVINCRGKAFAETPSQKRFRKKIEGEIKRAGYWWMNYLPIPLPCTSSVVVRRSALKTMGGLDPHFHRLVDDTDLWLRLVLRFGHGAVDYLPEKLVGYRYHQGQSCLPAIGRLFGVNDHKRWTSLNGKNKEILVDNAWFLAKWAHPPSKK